MKKLLLIFAVFLTFPLWKGFETGISAQVMVNKGSIIYMAGINDTIFANGGISNDSVGGIGGTFRNAGNVYVKNGDWSNSSGGPAFTNTAGLFGASTIDFYLLDASGSGPDIKGTSVTEFYNLNLVGNVSSDVKHLNGVNAKVKNNLNLNDRELATGANTVSVTNTSPGAITRSSGFISSTNGGGLIRSTASSQPYLFPVGASIRFRPVEITPDNSSANDFGVAMINGDATTDGFPVAQKEANISEVNKTFYHQVHREPGGSASATITVYYDDVMDGKFVGMGHWQNQPQWEDITAAPSAGGYGLSKAMTKQGWDFTSASPAFALIKLLNECGEMFVPTAFSPDNNGENDIEFVYGKCIQKIYFAIYDRWGEKVFETTDPTQGWDGIYKGKEMSTGVFVYYLQATLTTGEEVTKKGNISLFR